MRYELLVEQDLESEGINALDLSNFLRSFRAAYIVALSFVDYEFRRKNDDIEEQIYEINFREIEGSFRYYLRSNSRISQISFVSRKRLPSDIELEFDDISRNSPLRFVGYCTGASLLALSLAVAIAGGEVDLQNQTFKVQPLSEAVIQITRELRR